MARGINKGISVTLLLTLMVFLAGSPAVVYAQWDYDEISVAETTLSSASPNSNMGNSIDVYLNWDNSTGTNVRRRALIQFNLSSIPAGSLIQEARLRLYGSSYLANQRNLTVYRVSSNWTEMGATWVNADKSVPTPWGTRGGDYVLEGASTKNITFGFGWKGWDVREIVQDWVNGAPNYGFLLKVHAEEGENAYISFRAKEIAAYHPDQEPNLRVNYVPPPQVSLTQNGSAMSSLEIPVCTEFTYNLTISDIPDGYGMTGFDLGVSWNSSLMELLEFVEVGEEEARPWDSYVSLYADRVEYHGEGALWNETAVWASLTFHCTGPGASEITVYALEESIDLFDGEQTYHFTPEPYPVNCSQLRTTVGGFIQPRSIRQSSLPYIPFIILLGVLSAVFAIRKYHITLSK